MASRPSEHAMPLLARHRPHSLAIAPQAVVVASLRFALPRAVQGTVRVCDEQGATVRTLLEPTLPGGEACVHWDGHDARGAAVPRGNYVLRLEANGRVLASRRVTIA